MENYKLRSDNDWVIRQSDGAQVHSGNTEYLAWLALGNTPIPADHVPIDGSIAYKAMIRRRALKLSPIESILLLKSIGE